MSIYEYDEERHMRRPVRKNKKIGFSDDRILENITEHPMAIWKCGGTGNRDKV